MECLRKCLVEFIGTFFLVFTVGSAVVLGANSVSAGVAIGFALMVAVYAGGQISGGHYNPAVSLAAAIRGALEWKNIAQYWISQFIGAICAALLIMHYAPEQELATCPFSISQIIIGEFLFTFLLCYVVLLTATTKSSEGNCHYGLAIGSTVTVGAFAVGGILCYGAFNPAVALGLGTMQAACWGTVLVTVITNLVAGAIAALTYKFITKE